MNFNMKKQEVKEIIKSKLKEDLGIPDQLLYKIYDVLKNIPEVEEALRNNGMATSSAFALNITKQLK
jgi:hypothetical protein